jgi:hypothetical protein
MPTDPAPRDPSDASWGRLLLTGIAGLVAAAVLIAVIVLIVVAIVR